MSWKVPPDGPPPQATPWSTSPSSGVRRRHDRRVSGRPATTRPPPTSTPAAAPSPAARTASRSPATTCRPRPSSASPAPSRSTATTASSTRSASWWPGWSPCCWSPSCCATPAGTRWPTCWRSGCSRRPVRTAAGHLHARRLDLLPAGPDGRRRRAGRLAARSATSTGIGARSLVIVVVGVLMIVYVIIGGMKGTTWVQIVKAVLLIAGAAADDRAGAGEVRLQPVRPARRRRGRTARQGDEVPGTRA